jgi:hypothetical protein
MECASNWIHCQTERSLLSFILMHTDKSFTFQPFIFFSGFNLCLSIRVPDVHLPLVKLHSSSGVIFFERGLVVVRRMLQHAIRRSHTDHTQDQRTVRSLLPLEQSYSLSSIYKEFSFFLFIVFSFVYLIRFDSIRFDSIRFDSIRFELN